MKQVFIFLLMAMSCSLSAQNYHLFPRTSDVYFQLKNTSECGDCIYEFNIDSTYLTPSQDSVYRHLRLMNGVTSLDKGWWSCNTIRDSSYFGKYIQLSPNFTFTFFNRKGNSIFIKPNSELGNSWVAYQFPNNTDYIEANVTSINWENVYGIMDSVKTISFTARDSSGNMISHIINSLKMNISQHYGMIKSLNFLNFPDDSTYLNLVGHPNLNTHIHNIYWSDIYNFEIGDIFHIQEYHEAAPVGKTQETFFRDEIKTKQITSQAYIYGIERLEVRIDYQTDDTTVVFGMINKSYPLTHFSDSLRPREMWCDGGGCTMDYWAISNQYNVSYNSRIVKYEEATAGYMGLDSCLGFIMEIPPSIHYIEGGGGPYFTGSLYNYQDSRHLIFFQKGIEKWGVPIDFAQLTATEQAIFQKNNIQIQPNPSSNFLEISLKKPIQNGQIQIFNTAGKLIFSKNINAENQWRLDVSNYPTGIYILKIQTEEGVWSEKFIKN